MDTPLARIWTAAAQGRLDQDPVVHLLRDPATYWLAVIGGIIAYLAV